VRPTLINGAAGWVSLRNGEVYAVAAATVQSGRITALHILIDPVRLSQLDLTALDH
jgi:RNA polymerase sigma-70 factor (ECF subfamily)